MKCPFCAYPESKVVDSRPSDEGASIRRRRECLSCAHRFTTYETVEFAPVVVVKKDGRRQSFDRQKLLRGMFRACDKRPVSADTLEEVSRHIEQDIQSSMRREIPSQEIGEIVMRYLRNLDEVAYVRFASVYREFQDIHSFMSELNKLIEER